MSYKCEKCKKKIKKGIPQMKIVTKQQMMMDENSLVAVPQIREEKKVCPVCYGKVKR